MKPTHEHPTTQLKRYICQFLIPYNQGYESKAQGPKLNHRIFAVQTDRQ